MRKDKRKRLEAAGWKVSSSAEFLELSDEEVELVELKLVLVRAFKRLRERRKLTQVEAARLMKSSQSRVAMLERCDASVSIDLIVRGLIYLGSTRAQIGRMISASHGRGGNAAA